MRKKITYFYLLFAMIVSCEEPQIPDAENVPEIITTVTLTFTPEAGSGLDPVIVSATDPDDIGPQPIAAASPIALSPGVLYTLDIQFVNDLTLNPAERNITEEVREEGQEHMIFFEWTDGLFSNPSGNGNFDNRADPVNYDPADYDENGLPVGLSGTRWTPAMTPITGNFRIRLQHQPPLDENTPQKTPTSTVDDGDTDLDVTFELVVQ